MSRSGDSGKPPNRKGLSQEDAALWDLVAQSYEPLRQRMKLRVHGTASPDPSKDDATSAGYSPSTLRERAAAARHAAGHAAPHAVHPKPRPTKHAPEPAVSTRAPPLAEFDRKKAKKLAAGREAIDARIDLHGMRQSEAHAALRSFLLSCYASGRRNVLVITGKGGPLRGEDSSPSGFMDTRERGVLKRNVPHWLSEPEIRAIVVSYREAAQPHGGGGALYVHLRSRHRFGE